VSTQLQLNNTNNNNNNNMMMTMTKNVITFRKSVLRKTPQMGNVPNIEQNSVTHHRQKPTYTYDMMPTGVM
jgi:hypothetical protein